VQGRTSRTVASRHALSCRQLGSRSTQTTVVPTGLPSDTVTGYRPTLQAQACKELTAGPVDRARRPDFAIAPTGSTPSPSATRRRVT